jgi:hypothetical protein
VIDRHADMSASFLSAQLQSGCLCFGHIATGNHHASPRFRQRLGKRRAEMPARASDERNPSTQIEKLLHGG